MNSISHWRITVFLITVLGIYLTSTTNLFLVSAVTVSGGIIFIILIISHLRLEKKRVFTETLLNINEREIRLYQRDVTGRDRGDSYTPDHHPYAGDLDITGDRSLFQLCDRTATAQGKENLAKLLLFPDTQISAIRARQEAVSELKEQVIWRQDFEATGRVLNKEQDIRMEMEKREKIFSFDKPFYRIMLLVNPFIGFAVIVLIAFGMVPFGTFLLFLLLPFFIITPRLKKLNKIHSQLSRKNDFLLNRSLLITKIEEAIFSSSLLVSAKKELAGASVAFRQLGRIAKAFDYRLNMLVGILLNIFFLWDIRQAVRAERWEKSYSGKLPLWFDALAFTDALCSLAGFAFQNRDAVFPRLTEQEFTLRGKNLKHPFIDREKCVGNPVEFTGWKQFYIVTGANMAGKSTYLRTVGINMVLALAGAPVLAEEFVFSPVKLYTAIKTSDSLQDGESYFFAELKRLEMIIKKLEKGEKVFIILDEILRGTNSEDKQKGSKALLKKFIRLGASGMVATHDLALAELAEIFPDNVVNKRFEVEIKNNKLHFDYLLKDGISQNLNATFLMKRMGITD